MMLVYPFVYILVLQLPPNELILSLLLSPSFYSQLVYVSVCDIEILMTSSNKNIFRFTGLLCGEFTGHRWIPLTKASDAELWFFSSICAWTKSWANNGDAGDLRRNCAHYDVTIMWLFQVPHSHFTSWGLNEMGVLHMECSNKSFPLVTTSWGLVCWD